MAVGALLSSMEEQDGDFLPFLFVPSAVALIGVARPTRAVLGVVAWLLFVCCALGALSVGVLYVPTLAVAIAAAVRAA